MHDYDLDKLNARSFEQLTQSLAAELFGPGLVVFGDGPDGGREATFDGTLECPPSRKAWKGSGILQAKFRQRPDSEPKKNADWVIQQLKGEFQSFAQRPKRKTKKPGRVRVCPEYYVFATNVSLSAVQTRGGKDRVRAVLDSYKDTHGLKDYVVWDADQICRFLDASPGIRTTYAAWVVPGDVLSEMMRVLQFDKTDFPSVMRRYLESELLDDQFARLGQGGYTDAKNIPLSAVFIDVPVQRSNNNPEEERSTFLQFLFEEGRQLLKPSLKIEKHADVRAGRVVLIGGPGQGKTTVGQYACQLLRAALLRSSGASFSAEVDQALQRLAASSGTLPKVFARRYPLRVDLKNVAAALASDAGDKVSNLLEYLRKRIASRTNSTIGAEEFRTWLANYPWILVLDGLDEVPTSSNRQQLMQAIRDFISVESHNADADLLVLATTRPQGYSDEFESSLYRHVTLAPLNASEALTYGTLLADARHPGQRSRVEELTTSLTRATKNEATVRLMQSPLQVTIMLALIEGGGEPPEQRWKLFHDYYNVIYRREKERGTTYSTILGRYEPDIHWIHKRAGWVLQQRNAEPGRTSDRLSHAEFEAIADTRLAAVGHDNALERRKLVLTIRIAATDRLVLLVGNTENEIGFEIRSLQEFMAAEHSFDGGEGCVRKTLNALAPHSYWRNVFMFVAGRIFFERQELIDTIIRVLSELNEEPDSMYSATLAGSRLALGLLKDGAARNQPGATRIIARCAARALDVSDPELLADFADVFTGYAEAVLRTELLQRLRHSGPTFPYENWFLCFSLVGTGKKWAQEEAAKFPWHGVYARRFATRFGSMAPKAFWTTISRNFLSHPLWTFKTVLRPSAKGRVTGIAMPAGLKQMGAVLWPLNAANNDVVPLVVGDRQTGIDFRLAGEQSLRMWAEIDDREFHAPSAHPTWRICKAVCAFARNPSLQNLRQQLALIQELDLNGTSLRMAEFVPWQIGVPLTAKESGLAWPQIIERVSAGSLGSETDWTRRENQIARGLDLSQLRVLDEVTVSDDLKGLMFRYKGWSFRYTPYSIRLVEDLLQSLLTYKDLGPKQVLLDLCSLAIARFTYPISRQDARLTATPNEVLTAFRKFVKVSRELQLAVPNSIVMGVVVSQLSVCEKQRLLAQIGAGSLKEGYLHRENWTEIDNRLGSELPDLLSCGNVEYVLRALSFLPPLPAFQQLPRTLVDFLLRQPGDLADAGSILRLSSLSWTFEETPELVKRSIALGSQYPQHLINLIVLIEQNGRTTPEFEKFFLELMVESRAADDSDLLETATSTLIKLLDRRSPISSLPETVFVQ